MLKIGFIDYYLDEWHANNYPIWIKQVAGDKMQVCYAYGMIDSPITGMTSGQWCEKYNIKICNSIEEITELSDRIVILSPDNSEMHEALCQIPLRSGKPCYIDKTFAPNYDIAKRIFNLASEYNTPCFSTSALRYAEEYSNIETDKIEAICSFGVGDFNTYSIHQIEPILMMVKEPAKKILMSKKENWYNMTVVFESGKYATISGFGFEGGGPAFMMQIKGKTKNTLIEIKSDFFMNFIKILTDFFKDGKVPFKNEQTLEIMALRTAGLNGLKRPGVWIDVENS